MRTFFAAGNTGSKTVILGSSHFSIHRVIRLDQIFGSKTGVVLVLCDRLRSGTGTGAATA